MRHLLVLSILLLASPLQAAAIPQPWTAQESLPGGRAYDACLDKTVRFWGAGIPLAEVFAGVKEQTGVAIGFYPPDTGYERVCVNLFLNPEQPPAVRDLMTQLAWVTECGFAYTSEGDAPVYFLLAGTLGTDISKRLEEEEAAARQQQSKEDEAKEEDLKAQVLERLPEAIAALALSQGDAVARYQDQDYLMLAALVDPGRRATLELLASLSPEKMAQLQEHRHTDLPWRDVTPEQRLLIERSILIQEARNAETIARYGRDAFPVSRWSPKVAEKAERLEIETDYSSALRVSVYAVARVESGKEQLTNFNLTPFALVHDERVGAGWEVRAYADVQRALGKTFPQDDEATLDAEWAHYYRREELRASFETRLRQQCVLSEATEDLLASVHLPVRADDAHTLWRLQEAMAAATGLQVVSDCFLQQWTMLDERVKVLPPADPDSLTALEALQLLTVHVRSLPREVQYMDNPGYQSYEWGSAGSFLRFRSSEREVWRAAFLPTPAWQTMCRWVDPPLAAGIAKKPPWSAVICSLDLKDMARLVNQLTPLQIRFGGQLLYGDPTSPLHTGRHSLITALLVNAQENQSVYRLLAGLSDKQWAKLSGEGLVWEVDTKNVVSMQESKEFWWRYAKGDVLRLTTTPPKDDPKWGATHLPVDQAYWLEVTREGRTVGLYPVRCTYWGEPRPATYLPRPAAKAP